MKHTKKVKGKVMKKVGSFILMILMITSLITACGKDEKPTSEEISGGDVTLLEEPILNFGADEGSEEITREIGQDFNADVEAGLLWIDDQGRVTDKDGNVIEAYNYITAYSGKTLMSENSIMTGYTMTDDMQIIIDQEYIAYTEENSATVSTYIDTLRNTVANSAVEGVTAAISEPVYGIDDNQTRIIDSSDYHSDIIFGNWWENHQINGTPIADLLPQQISTAVVNSSYSNSSYVEFSASINLNKFKFIDEDTCTVDSVKRMDSTDMTLYGFYLQNCQKNTNAAGNRYFTGYIDANYVAVYGDFDKILNGDNVFMFADFVGLSDNDIPIFIGAYAEIITE